MNGVSEVLRLICLFLVDGAIGILILFIVYHIVKAAVRDGNEEALEKHLDAQRRIITSSVANGVEMALRKLNAEAEEKKAEEDRIAKENAPSVFPVKDTEIIAKAKAVCEANSVNINN